MNYPVWQLTEAGGGLLIAVIAIFHVYIAHFAVGGGLFLVLTEIKSHRQKDREIHKYLHGHAKFFLLLTMVAGGMSGVGIWFTIALLNPSATSKLIHTFVFGWAVEWVFFVIEICALFIYFYTFDRLEHRLHIIIGWIYFISAWMSLFIINGIIGFMLTPGQWLSNGSFWSGLFNPTFWPALFFRTFLAIIIAGLFGCVTATNIINRDSRHTILRHCASWLLAPFILFLGSAWWYANSLPPELQALIFQGMPELIPFIKLFAILSVGLILTGLTIGIRLPQYLSRSLALTMLIMGLLYIGAFEFIREGGRRPYIIRDYMFSTSILKTDMEKIRRDGLLKHARWVRHREITPENEMQAGREIFNILCLPCHSIGGPLNDIRKATKGFSAEGLEAFLGGMKHISPYMPPFAGNDAEKKALAHYIVRTLNGQSAEQPIDIRESSEVPSPVFDLENSKYILLGWAESSMSPLADQGEYLTIPSPGLTLRAQLILRGETPSVLTEGFTISYVLDDKHQTSRQPQKGAMRPESNEFLITIPAPTPQGANGNYQPYPVYTLTASGPNGEELCSTKLTAMVSTETACHRCHGGQWSSKSHTGLSSDTQLNILASHDKRSGTNFIANVKKSGPINCLRCHGDNPTPEGYDTNGLNLSAAIHAFHAPILADTADNCTWCHPASLQGVTHAYRGLHSDAGLQCADCHGDLRFLAVGLLRSELLQGKKHAETLLTRLISDNTSLLSEIQPRKSGTEQPDCLACHDNFGPGEIASAYPFTNKQTDLLFRNRMDQSGLIHCAACHNFAHALYPEHNIYGPSRENIQPMQYGNMPSPLGSGRNCKICHTVDMEDEIHHPNILGHQPNG